MSTLAEKFRLGIVERAINYCDCAARVYAQRIEPDAAHYKLAHAAHAEAMKRPAMSNLDAWAEAAILLRNGWDGGLTERVQRMQDIVDSLIAEGITVAEITESVAAYARSARAEQEKMR